MTGCNQKVKLKNAIFLIPMDFFGLAMIIGDDSKQQERFAGSGFEEVDSSLKP